MPRLGLRAVCALVFLAGLSPGAGRADDGPRASPAQPEKTVLFVVGDAGAEKQAALARDVLTRDLAADARFTLMDPFGKASGEDADTAAHGRATRAYEKGREAYDNLDLDQAVRLFGDAAAAIEADEQRKPDLELYTNVMIYLGASHVLTGAEKKGRRSFRKLLIVNPKAELNPMIFPPSLVRIFRSEAGRLGSLGRGAAEISSNPGGARVWIDGRSAGFTPVTIDDLIEGEHFLRLSARGYRARNVRLPITGGAQEMFDQSLDPLPKTVQLEKLVADLDDEVEGETRREELLQSLAAERLFFVRLRPAGQAIEVRGLTTRETESQKVNSVEGLLPGADPVFSRELLSVFSPLKEELGRDSGLAGGGEPGAGTGAVDEDPIWKAWWLWTAVGLVVVGGAGAALGLTLGDQGTPRAGEVIFKF